MSLKGLFSKKMQRKIDSEPVFYHTRKIDRNIIRKSTGNRRLRDAWKNHREQFLGGM